MLLLVITLIMGKAPNLNASREQGKFLLSPQGLNCLQLKIKHVPKWHIWGRG